MSIITPSRVELLPIHDPFFGPLQPSAMPAPPSTISPRLTTASFAVPLPPKLDRSCLDQLGASQYNSVTSWRKAMDGVPRATPSGRLILGEVRPNSNPSASTTSRSTSNPLTRISAANSIPRPAPAPDVFAPSLKVSFQSRPTTTSTLSSKRTRDPGSGGLSSLKRVKVEDKRELVKATAEIHKAEEERWRAKWVKVFPTLVFHFEIGAEEGQGRSLSGRVVRMGAKVDQFFSTRVTHLVVRGGTSPQKAKPMPPPGRRGDPALSPKNPFLDNTGVTDLVQKAEAMSIKVWTVKKLNEMLGRLAPVEAAISHDSLHTLLEDEKLHGTRERDLSAPRPDHYYFKPGSKYLLVEDATGKHRTIMVKEYPYSQKDGPQWPTLYEGFLRVSSSMQTNTPIEQIRERAWALYVDRVPYEGEQPPADLKRSISLRSLPDTPKLPEVQSYQNASGNSVVITSNIASTSNANQSPAFLNGLARLGANKDRAIMQMNKRVQVLKGNARLAAAKRQQTDLDVGPMPQRRASMGQAPPQRTFMTQEQVISMLQQAREPVRERKPTYEERVQNREKVEAGLKGREQDTAAGYCENCRLRYSDLSVHIASKKHRRFATNPENFDSLDNLLFMLQRPLNPNIRVSDCPPCLDRHTKDDPCDLCDQPPVWTSSQEGSGNGSEVTEYDEGSGDDGEKDEVDGEEE